MPACVELTSEPAANGLVSSYFPDDDGQRNLPTSSIAGLKSAKSEHELDTLLFGIAIKLGFPYYSYSGRFTLNGRDSIVRVLSNRPSETVASLGSCHGHMLSLIAGHTRGRVTPVLWSETGRAPNHLSHVRELLDAAQQFGLDDGVSFPIHDDTGDFGVLSFGARRSASDETRFGERLLADGFLIAAFVHEVMQRLVNKSAKVLEKPLTERETECLQLIAIGKSTWEMSKILGLSEHGVLHHVRGLMSKFGVHNRHQAVVRAMACGLL